MKKILMLIAVLFLVGCELDDRWERGRRQNAMELSQKVVTVDIGGYSYYVYTGGHDGYMAPTPETIKRCIREVAEEGK